MKNQSLEEKRFNPAPYFFILPSMVIFGIFVFFPFAKTIAYSFTLTNARGNPVVFVGFENYIKQFTSPDFLNSLRITFIFAPMIGIPTLICAYFLASLAHVRSRGSRIYEVLYSLPMAVASVPASVVWKKILSSEKNGIFNYLLGTEIHWLVDTKYALISVAIVTIWLQMGASFLFLLAGFRNVSDDVIESARIDGAGYFTRLFRIITPIASPQIFFVVFLNILTSFQAFGQIRLLTTGGPNYSTNVLVYSIYLSAMQYSRFETAFTQSMVLFFVVLIITLIQFRTEKKMVHYQ